MEEIIVYRKLQDMILLKENPRKISKIDMDRLVDSIRMNGFWKHRPITLSDRSGEIIVIAGNQRLKAAKKLKLAEVPTVLYQNLTEEQEKDIVLRDNINNGDWDFLALQSDYWGDTNFDFIGLSIPDPDEPKAKGKKKQKPETDEEPEDDLSGEFSDKEVFYR
jgi:hypothetical protein